MPAWQAETQVRGLQAHMASERCKAARAGQPAPPRKRKREPEIKPKPEIKQEPEIKLEPEIKQEPFTIRGYFGIRD